jgi:broad specificity phosphatase PhoE
MSTLVLVRHAQASFGAADYDQLSPLGQRQAELLGAHLAQLGESFDAVFTGPARRHRDTAAIAGAGAHAAGVRWPEPIVVDELDEHDSFGLMRTLRPELRDRTARAWDGAFVTVMRGWLRGELTADGIESWPTFRARVQRGLTRVLNGGRGRRVLAFTSAGPAAVVLQHALGTSEPKSYDIAWRLRNSALCRFLHDDERLTLDALNLVGHLPEPALWTLL